MSNIPADLKYTNDHEWARVQGTVVVVGITDHAQRQLGDVVYVELPKVGDVVSKGEAFGTVESVKAVSELYAPISGKVVKVNQELDGDPEMVNTDPYSDGWIIELESSNAQELSELMDAAAYQKLIASEE